jgi:glucose/arabinose dehydrogenase
MGTAMEKRCAYRLLKRAVLIGAIAASAPAAPAGGPGAASLTVPPGFVVESVATAPLVRKAALACFDDRGRLFVAGAAGAIHVLEDTDGDGRFDSSAVFADNVAPARGLLWHDGAVFVASFPSLWRLRDTDGDGAADERRELITGFARSDAGDDDVRAASLGPDGYVYTCAGRHPHDLKDVNGKPLHKGAAPMLVRCRSDGSGAEVVGGLQGSAVDVAWSAQGDAFVSGSLYGSESPRDAIVHSVEGGEYPVPPEPPPRRDVKRAVEPLPPLVTFRGAAPAGLTCYRGFTLGRPFTGNLFAACAGARAVRRFALIPDGSTFRARGEEFVTSSDDNFHPSDVLEDADGSVLVIDAGAGDESPGAIYRVHRDNAVRLSDPRGLRLKWDRLPVSELARRLEDLRPAVAERALRQLARRGDESVDSLTELLGRSLSATTRLNAVWALTRIEGSAARAAVVLAMLDHDAGVRQAAAYSAGLHADAGATAALIELLRTDAPPVRREAANALGRIGLRRAALLAQAAPATQPAQTQPSQTQPSQTQPGQTQPGQARASQTQPAQTQPVQKPPATQPQAARASVATASPSDGGAARVEVVGPPGAGGAVLPGGPPDGAAPPSPPVLPPSPAVPALLDALRGTPDRFLEHAIVYALARIQDAQATRKGLQDPDPSVRRGAQLALDRMNGPTP